MHPPATSLCSIQGMLVQGKTGVNVSAAIMFGAMANALLALAINWTHEQFDYSIGGISLSIDKAGNYESLHGLIETKWQAAIEDKVNTHKYFKGITHPRWAGKASMDPHSLRLRASNGYPAFFSV
jgi:hypothetical protein